MTFRITEALLKTLFPRCRGFIVVDGGSDEISLLIVVADGVVGLVVVADGSVLLFFKYGRRLKVHAGVTRAVGVELGLARLVEVVGKVGGEGATNFLPRKPRPRLKKSSFGKVFIANFDARRLLGNSVDGCNVEGNKVVAVTQ